MSRGINPIRRSGTERRAYERATRIRNQHNAYQNPEDHFSHYISLMTAKFMEERSKEHKLLPELTPQSDFEANHAGQVSFSNIPEYGFKFNVRKLY